jgi:hypothetical protein
MRVNVSMGLVFASLLAELLFVLLLGYGLYRIIEVFR